MSDTNVVKTLFPQQIADRHDAHKETALHHAESTALYYSAPPPYRSVEEKTAWETRLAGLREVLKPLATTLLDDDAARIKATVESVMDAAALLLAPSEIEEAERQAREDWRAAKRPPCRQRPKRYLHCSNAIEPPLDAARGIVFGTLWGGLFWAGVFVSGWWFLAHRAGAGR